MLTFFATFLVATQVALVALVLRSPIQRRRLIARYRWVRWSSWGHAFVLFSLVAIVAVVLAAWFPVLDWSWWTMLGGEGNARLATVDPAQRESLPRWIAFLPVLAIPSLLILAPLLAHQEERVFRRGAHRRSPAANAGAALAFGAAHLVVGVPLWAAAALAAMGLYLNRQFRQHHVLTLSVGAATRHVTAIHLTYNLALLSLLGAALSLALLGLTHTPHA